MTSPTIEISKLTCQGRLNQNWFLPQDTATADTPYIPVPSTFKALINGQETFETLYDHMSKAEKTIDIAIWGFQPSMFFRRDGEAICVGDLLIQKAQENCQVKVLVWSMWFNLQTFKEANLGNFPELMMLQKRGEDFVSHAQQEYDHWWYRAIKGDIGEQHCHYLSSLQHKYPMYHFNQLFQFSRQQTRANLQFKKRSVEKSSHDYPEESNLPYWNQFVLWTSPSNHQKTVLIDYELPNKAVGFVLEHNMLDSYWDESTHFSTLANAKTKRNAPIPLQDVSSLVTGQVLWDINHNFCQSWDRRGNINLPSFWDPVVNVYNQPLTPLRSQSRQQFPVRTDKGKPLMAQILRTYDNPREENIRQMYLQNIKKTAHFIYTENQYFRWTELVREYQNHWQRLKDCGRDIQQPIYWFVVTNSNDYGIGSGTYNTHEMLALLGRQDVMPGIATHLDEESANDKAYKKYDEYKKQTDALEQRLEKMEQGKLENLQEYEKLKQQLSELKAAEQQAIQAQYEEIKQLKRDVSDTVGIRAHICTLTSLDAWQEVYIHSKVTIIDDVFTFIGSANLNTRSMQVDTELGIILECKEVANNLRYDLWGLHTNNNPDANPKEMNSIGKTKDVFRFWEDLMKSNFDARMANEKPLQPLCEFLRLTTDISKAD